MRTNGTIAYEITPEGSLNEYGEPVAAASTWSAPTECAISVISDNRKGRYEDGIFRQASFSILIEGDAAEQQFSRIRLTRAAEQLGEFQVQSVTPVPTAGRTKIIV